MAKRKRKLKNIPSYLKGLEVSVGERILITRHNGNWPLMHKELLSEKKNRSPEFILKIMWVEIHRDPPRQGVLERLASRYGTVSRATMNNELVKFMDTNPIKESITTRKQTQQADKS